MPRALNIVMGAGLALVLSQVPEFAQQYEQRLGGAVDELSTIVTDFDATAAREGLDRQQALARYDASSDTFLAARGADMRETFARYDRLSAHLAAITGAGPIDRVVAIATYFDARVAEGAVDAYRPAVPATTEGLAYAGAGAIGGYGLTGLALAPFRRRRRKAPLR